MKKKKTYFCRIINILFTEKKLLLDYGHGEGKKCKVTFKFLLDFSQLIFKTFSIQDLPISNISY